MDQKWIFASRHAITSLSGIFRLFLARPGFASALFCRRLKYFQSRRFDQPILTPDKFQIDTPDTLIAYWSMFVERELHHPLWVNAVKTRPKPLVVDVGANAGTFSHYVHVLNPTCEFVAFEPLPPMAERIRSLRERTRMDLVLHQQAVSKSCGEALFESPHGYDGTSRFSSAAVPGANTFKVETTTLDTALANRKVTVMKIDVEGYECDVIEGGKAVLEQTDYVIIEAEAAEHLSNITRALGSKWSCRKLAATDYLFIREPH